MTKDTKSNKNKTVTKKEKKVKDLAVKKEYPYCEYKYSQQDNYAGAKFVYNAKLGKKGRRLQYLWLPLVFFMVVGLLVWDVLDNKSIILDVVLLAFVAVVEVVTLCMPLFLKRTQAKLFKNLKLDECELLRQDILDNELKEYFIKNGEVISQTTNEYSNISAVGEDAERILIMFGSGINMSVIRKDSLHGVEASTLLDKFQKYTTEYAISNYKKK